jgi:biopolymer transport protein ExbD
MLNSRIWAGDNLARNGYRRYLFLWKPNPRESHLEDNGPCFTKTTSMADLAVSPVSKRKRGSMRRPKKLSTRVDFTPLVDLGFLLITFFMVTTTWSKMRAMNIFLPAEGKPINIAAEVSLTLLPLPGKEVFYYQGTLSEAISQNRCGISHYNEATGIGSVIRSMQAALDNYRGFKTGRKGLFVTIKPTWGSSFGSVVRVLDEMAINGVTLFALTDPSEEEVRVLREKKLLQ